jgi:hypothetical protein
MSMAVLAFADGLAARHAERADQNGHRADFNRASLSWRVPLSSGRLGWVRPRPTQPEPCRAHRRGERCWRPSRNIALQFERLRQMRLQPTRLLEEHRAWRGVCGRRYRTRAPMRRRRQSVIQRHENDLGDHSGGKRLLSVEPRRVLGEAPAPLSRQRPSPAAHRQKAHAGFGGILKRAPSFARRRSLFRSSARTSVYSISPMPNKMHAEQDLGTLCQKRKG